jgi:hypothetical protein
MGTINASASKLWARTACTCMLVLQRCPLTLHPRIPQALYGEAEEMFSALFKHCKAKKYRVSDMLAEMDRNRTNQVRYISQGG